LDGSDEGLGEGQLLEGDKEGWAETLDLAEPSSKAR
jgi:hypothetical protein